MSLELLKGFERMKIRVGVVQANDKAHGHQVVFTQVIEEAAAIGFRVLSDETKLNS